MIMEKVNKVICLCSAHSQTCFQRKLRYPGIGKFRYISTFKDPLLYRTGYGTGPKARVEADLDTETVENLERNNLKLKDHPGVFRVPKVSLPEKIQKGIREILLHNNVKDLAKRAKSFANHLWLRNLPIEEDKLKEKMIKLEQEVKAKDEVLLPFLSEEETLRLEQKTRSRVINKTFQKVYNWEPIHFSKEICLLYLLARSASEYAAINRIFNEISKRDPEFQPKALCDFGSGVGSVTWAARNYWASSLIEHLCTDISEDMNALNELILRGGHKNDDHPIPALFFRHHLPESYKIQYDLVVSAFSLMELPSAKARIELIDKLWKKTRDEGYLVIAENGTKQGFRAVIEARDYVLGLHRRSRRHQQPNKCHVFSPCPSSQTCPRFVFDVIPCCFTAKYRPIYPFHHDGCETSRFSYVVLKKEYPDPQEERWPRLVADPLKRSGHVICRVCTKDAKISEVVLTRSKHSMQFRVLARRSRWGDQLPIHLSDIPKQDQRDVVEEDEEAFSDLESETKPFEFK